MDTGFGGPKQVDARKIDGYDEVWRQGELLVAPHDAVLPPPCVKTNSEDGLQLVGDTLFWRHRKTTICFWIGPLVRREMAVSSYKKMAVVMIGLFFFAAGCMGLAAENLYVGLGFLLAGAIMAVTGISILSLVHYRLLTAVHMDGDFVWVEGACAEYLSSLPELDSANNAPAPSQKQMNQNG